MKTKWTQFVEWLDHCLFMFEWNHHAEEQGITYEDWRRGESK